MGWTGTYHNTNPKGKERIALAIRQEGFEFEIKGRSSKVIDSALVGNTVYLAVRFWDDNPNREYVYGAVILTGYNKGEFLTKGMSENMGPCSYDCPKHILDKLTATDNEYAIMWRDMCEKVRAKKREQRRKVA